MNLDKFNSIMTNFQENMCAVDPFNLRTNESSKKKRELIEQEAKHKRKEVNFQSQFHLYGLFSSFLNIFSFYVFQLLFFITLMIILYRTVNIATWIFNKHEITSTIITQNLISIASINQFAAIGALSRAYFQPPDKFFPIALLQISESNRIKNLFDDTDFFKYNNLVEKFDRFKKQSLCSFTPSLTKRTELCDLLSDGIAKKGIVQAFYHSEYLIRDILATLSTNPDFLSQTINKQNFVEFIYSHQQMFYESEIFMLDTISENMKNFVQTEAELIITEIAILLIVFITMSLLCMGYTLKTLNERQKIILFSYQLISIEILLQNAQLKVKFNQVMKVENQNL